MQKAHLVVVGFDEIVTDKYLPCIEEGILKGFIDSYSIIDIQSEKEYIEQRIELVNLKPENIFFLPDRKKENIWAEVADFEPIFKTLINQKGKLKVYIATELKAHEEYLRFCVENGIDSLVEKPVLAPMLNGQFNPSSISDIMNYLIQTNIEKKAKHSVMTLSRYHKIYNEEVLIPLSEKMLALESPITSFHFRTAGGVWNMHSEYETREDHPYKYGYGMLMHGAYHYIDLATQFLNLNKLIFPDVSFSLTLSSYAAFPIDQNDRISKKFSSAFDDNRPDWSDLASSNFGETDITTTFCLKNKHNGRTITLGTLSFEQTTPSYRSWKLIPPNLYNKNGRMSNVDIEAQLSTLYSVHVRCYDVPILNSNNEIEKVDGFAQISTRANAAILRNELYNSIKTFNGVFHRESNKKLLNAWIEGIESRSSLESHAIVMKLTEAIALSIKKQGTSITIDFS